MKIIEKRIKPINRQVIELPQHYRIISMHFDNQHILLYVLADPAMEPTKVTLELYLRDTPVSNSDELIFIGQFKLRNMFYLFERRIPDELGH